MNNFTDRKGINLDITTKCTLQCIGCDRMFLDRKNPSLGLKRKEMSIEVFEKIIDHFSYVRFCGNLSDPIFHPHFITFLKKLYAQDKKALVHTAASHKKMSWYKEAFAAHPGARWKFGIDGLPHQSHLYRTNQDGEKLFKVMLMCKEMGLETVWQYIIFSYNENNIEEAQTLAAKYNIKIELTKTHRYGTHFGGEWLKPSNKNIIKNYSDW